MRQLLAAWLILASSVLADDRDTLFRDSVEPLLRTKCFSCHGGEKQEGQLRLDSREAALRGGENGPALVESQPDQSLIIRAVRFDDPDLQMPPKNRLTAEEVAALTKWIEQGAHWPAATVPAIDPNQGGGDAFSDPQNPIRQLFRGERLDLWSLKPPQRDANHRSVDEFVTSELSRMQLALSEEADRRTLIRRLTSDLTGLPPTPEEVVEFETDKAPDAYEKLVERLLASPRYGERQARLWLDVVRYADTHGYERDEFRPLAWKYRDYVVRAFNQDKPFDRFILEQLAGDEIAPSPPSTLEEADALIATGYLQLGQWDSTAAIFQESDRLRADEQSDLTNTTAAAFLGLTMSCCQCHDHKYDPLSQADHYRLRAFFAGVQRRDDLVVELPAGRQSIDEHNAPLQAEKASLDEELKKLSTQEKDHKDRIEQLKQQIAAIEGRLRHPAVTMGATDRTDPPATQILYQGDFSAPREEVAPGFVSVVKPGPAEIVPPREGTTGRRLALARWFTSRDNPWTARVFVNRIWQQHFGTGIVATPNDFGYTGARPTNQLLLDWLAIEFMERGWSVKHLHRMIVLSQTYRQQSRQREAGRLADPDNHSLWRQNVRRLDAETLRDSLLQVSGLLRTDGGGPARWPEVPQELLYAQPAIQEAIKGEDGGRMQGWFTSPVEETNVRSLYLVRKRCLPIPFLQAFDLPGTETSCARRDQTVVAPQALMLLNSPESVRYVQAFADRLGEGVDDQEPRDQQMQHLISEAFRLALCRAPQESELQVIQPFLNQLDQQQGLKPAAVLLARAVLNLNEFMYYD